MLLPHCTKGRVKDHFCLVLIPVVVVVVVVVNALVGSGSLYDLVIFLVLQWYHKRPPLGIRDS